MTNYTKIIVLCIIIVLELIRFLGKVLSNTEIFTKFVYFQTIDCPLLLTEILVVFHFASSLHKAESERQHDHKWEYLKKCDILRFLQRQNINVFCLDDYMRDLHHGNLSRHELMRHEWARFLSFNTFPQAVPNAPSALTLARNGFYYTDVLTIVECFCCQQRYDATIDANTDGYHSHHSETCAFVNGRGTRNIPVNCETSPNSRHSNCNAGRPNSTTHPLFEAQQTNPGQNHNLQRARSEINSQLLASGGFCHPNVNDEVTCFECGLRLKRSLLGNDPWKVHALISPHCKQVKRIKGVDFIRRTHSATSVENQRSVQALEEPDSLLCVMQSPMVQRILQLGYEVDRVRNAIIELRRRHGPRELTPKELFAYIQSTEPNLIGSSTKNILPAALRNFVKKRKERSQAEAEREQSQSVVVSQLEDEVIRLKHEKLCKVCLEKDMCIVFLPCGHLVACDDCATALRKCPVCRAHIKGTIRTYMS